LNLLCFDLAIAAAVDGFEESNRIEAALAAQLLPRLLNCMLMLCYHNEEHVEISDPTAFLFASISTS